MVMWTRGHVSVSPVFSGPAGWSGGAWCWDAAAGVCKCRVWEGSVVERTLGQVPCAPKIQRRGAALRREGRGHIVYGHGTLEPLGRSSAAATASCGWTRCAPYPGAAAGASPPTHHVSYYGVGLLKLSGAWLFSDNVSRLVYRRYQLSSSAGAAPHGT